MLGGIKVNVIDVPLEVSLATNGVFPKSALPKCILPVPMASDGGARSDDGGGKMAFDQMPTVREIRIAIRQGHDDMEMIGQHHDCIDHEGMFAPRSHHRRAQGDNVVGQDTRRSIRECRGKEECPAREEISPVANHVSRLSRISLNSIW
jgi:hypothetical protein